MLSEDLLTWPPGSFALQKLQWAYSGLQGTLLEMWPCPSWTAPRDLLLRNKIRVRPEATRLRVIQAK